MATRKSRSKRPIHNTAVQYTKNHVLRIYSETPETLCFRFGEPNSSIYHIKVAVVPGHIFLGGDIGELVITHYGAIKDPKGALEWLCGDNSRKYDWFDYHLGKSSEKEQFDLDASRAVLRDEIKTLEDQRRKELSLGSAADSRTLSECSRMIDDIQDIIDNMDENDPSEVARSLYNTGRFDDWHGGYSYTRPQKMKIAILRLAGEKYLKEVYKRERKQEKKREKELAQ